MQARQALIYPRGSFSFLIVVVATIVAAAFGLALVVGVHPAVVSQRESTFAQHQQAPDAAERNAQLNGADRNQSPDAKDRNRI